MRKVKDLSNLIGQTLSSIRAQPQDEEVVLKTEEGRTYVFYHNQACCEDVYLEDVVGDPDTLLGTPIVQAGEVISFDNPKKRYEGSDDYHESHTWSFYKFATAKGYVTLRFYGSSNGCYSERMIFAQELDRGDIKDAVVEAVQQFLAFTHWDPKSQHYVVEEGADRDKALTALNDAVGDLDE